MSRRVVLLTRPEGAAAARSLPRLKALGWEGIHVPLTRMEALPDPGLTSGALDPAAAQALIFTSAEGLRRFAALSGFRGRPVHAVGAATASAARAAGFAQVEEGGGDVRSLALHLAARLRPEAGPALHFGAEAPAGDLAGDLAGFGLRLIRIPLYRTLPLTRLPESALRAEGLRAALFHAPSAARAFAALRPEPAALEGIFAATISAAAAEPLEGLGFRGVLRAARPDEAHMLGVLAALG